MTNLEGRVILRRGAITPPEGVRSDLEVIAGLGREAGLAITFETEPEAVFEELRRASAGGRRLRGDLYQRIADEKGVFWPCPTDTTNPGHPACCFADTFDTPDGRARFVVPVYAGPAEATAMRRTRCT
ncbi:hypothetical protein [Nocardioides kongjuensis]|uniref:hypothetical protein n=1 Tax=Nocardioides kongjuensis TaxID=349522 RepID=UPI0031EE3088